MINEQYMNNSIIKVFAVLIVLLYASYHLILLGFHILSRKKANKNTDSYEVIHNSEWIASKYYSYKELARIATFVTKYYKQNTTLYLNNKIRLKQYEIGDTKIISNFELFIQGNYFSDLESFGLNYTEEYKNIYQDLHKRALDSIDDESINSEILEILVNSGLKTEDNTNIKPIASEEITEKTAQENPPSVKTASNFISEINTYYESITSNTVRNQLKETCRLLEQIQELELTIPDFEEKVSKLYDHYLPILIQILDQYNSLQTAINESEYKKSTDSLVQTLTLINGAMKTITSSMTEGNYINLSADMETLKAILNKDGYSNQMTMHL